jgi:plastocyanin
LEVLRCPVALSIALLLVVAVGPTTARGEARLSLVPELRLAAGYDDNLFLDANPQGVAGAERRADTIVDVAPRVVGRALASGHSTRLSLDYLERITPHNGDLRDLVVRADWLSPPLDGRAHLQLGLGASYELYDADRYPDNRFHLGAAEATLAAIPHARLRIEARYRFGARRYTDPTRLGQLDLEHRAGLALVAPLDDRWTLGANYVFLDLASSNERAVLRRHRGELSLAVRPIPVLSLGASYAFSGQHLPTAAQPNGVATRPRDDLQHEVRAAISVQPLAWLEIFLRDEFLLSTSTEKTGDWSRNQVLAGVTLFTVVERRVERLPPSAPRVRAREVTFRWRGRAHTVEVLGDFTGWEPRPLAARGDDTFEATYTLPPGRWVYSYRIDGTIVAPPDAPAYVEDGFGGRNGVLVVR